MKLLLATRNLHKIREFKEMFKCYPHIDLMSLIDFPHYKPPEETGITFQENAMLKARHAADHLNLLTFADDSGLVVPSINGEPGIYSARYVGEKATDAENRKLLLERLKGKGGLERAAYYETCLALCTPKGPCKTVNATCEGVIVDCERGKRGFGYDPLFCKYDYHQTFGELDEQVKNRISHRRKAFDKLSLIIEGLST